MHHYPTFHKTQKSIYKNALVVSPFICNLKRKQSFTASSPLLWSLQEEHTLCSLSGSAVTPESQLEESTSPADTTEDDPLPMRPWGRSQSLPAYADLIMVNAT